MQKQLKNFDNFDNDSERNGTNYYKKPEDKGGYINQAALSDDDDDDLRKTDSRVVGQKNIKEDSD